MNQAEHRTKNFRVREFAVRRDAVKNRRIYEISGFVARHFCVAPVHQDFGSRFFAFSNQFFDALFALRRDDRAHLHAFIESIADAEF